MIPLGKTSIIYICLTNYQSLHNTNKFILSDDVKSQVIFLNAYLVWANTFELFFSIAINICEISDLSNLKLKVYDNYFETNGGVKT